MKAWKTSLITTVASSLLALGLLTTGCGSQSQEGDAANAKPYPLNTCLVSDEPLGSMGEPVSLVYNGQEIKLCCKSCIKDFNAEPEKYLAKLTNPPEAKSSDEEQ